MRDILSVLQQIEPELSKSERILAALLRNDAEFIVNAGITDVAERAGVSPPTVTRFAVGLAARVTPPSRCRLPRSPSPEPGT